ncbi:hypothetical protein GCM10010989_30710 [Croceicoccus pelagius]|uniref:BLUF domain-containing protein n=3 Tax=Croceicoccus pelagius TaxID=1703341 RepID=A0A917DNQ0_9SPHN|nr:hypothetical protein GCM10010989_30710 [Croceicoccus pelagius]
MLAMSQLCTLLYVSKSLITQPESINELLTVSRDINIQKEITGVLVLNSGRFLQVLEGHPDNVQLIYSRIVKDPRHEEVRLLLNSPISGRRFGRWSMAFLNPEEVPPILGATSFDELRLKADKTAGELLSLIQSMVTSDAASG